MKNISETEVNNMGFGKTIELFGRNGHTCMVHIDKAHPRRSFCNRPFTECRRVVCKHMIALYSTAGPKMAKDF